MTSAPSRIAAAGIAAIAALAITACTPPNENPSDQKVDTAMSQSADSLASSGSTGAAKTANVTNVADASAAQATATAASTTTVTAGADATPLLNNCGVTGLQRPSALNLDCEGNKERLEDIVWDEWTANGASGTATQVTVDPDRVVEGVSVVLGAPQNVDGVVVFGAISVDGQPVNPESNY